MSNEDLIIELNKLKNELVDYINNNKERDVNYLNLLEKLITCNHRCLQEIAPQIMEAKEDYINGTKK